MSTCQRPPPPECSGLPRLAHTLTKTCPQSSRFCQATPPKGRRQPPLATKRLCGPQLLPTFPGRHTCREKPPARPGRFSAHPLVLLSPTPPRPPQHSPGGCRHVPSTAPVGCAPLRPASPSWSPAETLGPRLVRPPGCLGHAPGNAQLQVGLQRLPNGTSHSMTPNPHSVRPAGTRAEPQPPALAPAVGLCTCLLALSSQNARPRLRPAEPPHAPAHVAPRDTSTHSAQAAVGLLTPTFHRTGEGLLVPRWVTLWPFRCSARVNDLPQPSDGAGEPGGRHHASCGTDGSEGDVRAPPPQPQLCLRHPPTSSPHRRGKRLSQRSRIWSPALAGKVLLLMEPPCLDSELPRRKEQPPPPSATHHHTGCPCGRASPDTHTVFVHADASAPAVKDRTPPSSLGPQAKQE